VNSANFVMTEFSEVRPAFGGHTIVCLIRKMMKNAPAQMANRETKNATVACRPSLLNGASVRALSTTSSATLASMAATDAIERKALWIIPGPLYTLYNLEPWPSLSCPYSRSTWKGNSANFAVTEFYEVRA
jgi:hypothetical protein